MEDRSFWSLYQVTGIPLPSCDSQKTSAAREGIVKRGSEPSDHLASYQGQQRWQLIVRRNKTSCSGQDFS